VKASQIFCSFVLAAALSCLAQAKQLVIVAEKTAAPANIKTAELTAILNSHHGSEGKQATIVMRDPSSPDGQLFLRRLLNLNSDQMHSYVQAHPGLIVIADSDDAILRIVSGNRSALGVIDLYSLTKDVSVVKLDGKLPLEPGYLLKGN
jgi:hypothetical protein